jgi:hypothetical protein
MYDPRTISETDAAAILARLARYVGRHGSPLSEAPLSPEAQGDAVGEIVCDWYGADWGTLEALHLQRSGRLLFSPDWSDLTCHLRAALYMAGRARRRRWHPDSASGQRGRADARRRDPGEFDGAGQASRSASPERIVAAAEEASGELVLSPAAVANRSRRRQPLRVRGVLRSIPRDYAAKRLRWTKRRNGSRILCHVDGRRDDRTLVRFERVTIYRFDREGSILNREMPRTIKRPDVSRAAAVEIIGG